MSKLCSGRNTKNIDNDFVAEDVDVYQGLSGLYDKVKRHQFHYENLAFEGGSMKCLAYGGAVKVLEDLGILEQCKRFSGTSGGSAVAAILSMKGTAAEVKQFMEMDKTPAIYDSKWGKLSFLPNLLMRFGWNPGAKVITQFEEFCVMKTGKPDITFKEVYKKYGTELCVVASNITTMTTEYFHPKFTPHMSVATAVRASVSLPVLLQPVKLQRTPTVPHYFVDGGLCCNFPVHCFDGWYLSMKTEDSFFHRIGSGEKPFGVYNPKTLGFLVYSVDEGEFMKGDLLEQFMDYLPPRPDTIRARERGKLCDELIQSTLSQQEMFEAGRRFLQALADGQLERDGAIAVQELREIFKTDVISKEDKLLLFGKDFNMESAFEELDKDSNGKVSFQEFLWFMQSKGVAFRSIFEGGNLATVDSVGDFMGCTLATVMNMSRKIFFKERDPERTVGLYTDYVRGTDFEMDPEDKEFLFKQGVIGCLAFLKNSLPKETE